MLIYLEKTIFDQPLICINGSRRGILVGLHRHYILRTLNPTPVEAANKA